MSESVGAFSTHVQNTCPACGRLVVHVKGDGLLQLGVDLPTFSQAVDNAIERTLGITSAQLHGKGQARHITRARQIAWFLLRQQGASLPKLGQIYNRDHTTVQSGIDRYCALYEHEAKFRGEVQSVRSRLIADGYKIGGDA